MVFCSPHPIGSRRARWYGDALAEGPQESLTPSAAPPVLARPHPLMRGGWLQAEQPATGQPGGVSPGEVVPVGVGSTGVVPDTVPPARAVPV